jgi:hypothetical protein
MMRYARDTRRSGIAMSPRVSDVVGMTFPVTSDIPGWTDFSNNPVNLDGPGTSVEWDSVTVDARNVRFVPVVVKSRKGVRAARVCGGCGLTRSASGVCDCLV